MTLANVTRDRTPLERSLVRQTRATRQLKANSTRGAVRALPILCSVITSCGTSGDLTLGRLGTSAASAPNEAGAAQMTPAPVTADVDAGPSAAPLTDAGTTSPEAASSTLADAAPEQPPEASPVADPCSALGLPTPSERFDLSGTGTEVVDLIGGPSGQLLGGAQLSGQGQIELDGDDDYIDLPNGLISSKSSATIFVWVSLIDGPAYWRVFDFGAASEGEDSDEFAVGTTYVAVTTETGLDPSGLALLIGHGGASSEDRALTSLVLDQPMAGLAVVLDGQNMTAALYVDGESVAQTTLTSSLSEIEDFNNWLGRSQYSADPHYPGTYDEVRLYSEALSPCQVSEIARLPPDATP